MRQIAFAAIIAMSFLSYVVASPAQAATPTAAWTISPSVTTPQFNTVDIRPAYLTDAKGFWMIYSGGSNIIYRYYGTSVDHLTKQATGTLDSSFVHTHGERYWLGGAYTDGHIWYATVHVEFDYNATPSDRFNWFRKIGLATSTDKGLHWHYQGDIITSAQPTNIANYASLRYFNDGPGDQTFFEDWRGGYFYIYYTVSWVDKNTGERWEGTRAARCPIASKMAPGCWKKYDQGSWSQPGIHGQDSDIFLDEDNGSIFYDTYLGKYVAIGHSTANVTYMTTATSLTSQNWTPLTHFAADSQMYWYNWIIDPATADVYTIGRTFRVYSAQNDYAGVQTKYMTVTLQSGANTSPLVAKPAYQYPYTSVPDHTPGWQRWIDQPYDTIINPDFALDPNIPTGWETWPYLWQTSTYGISIVTSPSENGTAAVRIDASKSSQSVEQTITVFPNTTYTLSAWAQEADLSHPIYVGVKDFGGDETRIAISSTDYSQGSVTFTTGPASSTARIYLWKPAGGVGYGSNVTLSEGD